MVRRIQRGLSTSPPARGALAQGPRAGDEGYALWRNHREIVVPENQFSEAAAGKRLDKVRDIRVLVKTESDVTDPSTSSARSRQLPPPQKKVMWAEMDSGSDA